VRPLRSQFLSLKPTWRPMRPSVFPRQIARQVGHLIREGCKYPLQPEVNEHRRGSLILQESKGAHAKVIAPARPIALRRDLRG
jgi:hypothetical protein